MSSLCGSPASGTSRSVFFFRFTALRMVSVFVSSCAGCCGPAGGSGCGPPRPLCCDPCTAACTAWSCTDGQKGAPRRSSAAHPHASLASLQRGVRLHVIATSPAWEAAASLGKTHCWQDAPGHGNCPAFSMAMQLNPCAMPGTMCSLMPADHPAMSMNCRLHTGQCGPPLCPRKCLSAPPKHALAGPSEHAASI